ncbi:MAG: type II secretion system F family protein [Candidatus Uhrbacteria bacterium]|nr:type II secretion system F family protein [Candidatus Uhrbacteria bacterium]MDP3793210.1 type II secretion system F family protein [Candidatus Uhrbacteria bacterium]
MDSSASLLLQILLIATIFALVAYLLWQSLILWWRERRASPTDPNDPRGAALRGPSHDRTWPQLKEQTPRSWESFLDWSGLPKSFIRKTIFILSIFLFVALIFQVFRLFLLLLMLMVFLIGMVIWKANARRKKFTEQLPDALDALVQGLRAGYALPHALAMVERETREPSSLVFGSLARAQEYRLNFGQAVKMIDGQLNVPGWALVTEALHMQNRVGGNMIPVLTKIAEGLRDRSRIEQEIHTATASGKFSGLIISALAPLSFLLFYFLSPTYVDILIHSTLGIALLSLAAVLEVIGFLFIWSIVSLDY